MKKVFLYFSFPLFMVWATSNIYAAASCKRDFDDIGFEVQEGSLRTTNGSKIDAVQGPVKTGGDESCGAHASYNHHHLHYAIFWKAGDWKHTLVAYFR
ncbi:hypothetical protein [Candidatus Sororendozoicomonas aggregata]|uniref:hypothetical protein n=1 Tax=Candidatus Sororendozoicomonas aggregata TaxID=3073239 RepID=UPI002ED11D24